MRSILFAFALVACNCNSKPPETNTPPPPSDRAGAPTSPPVVGAAAPKGGAPAGPRVEGQGFVVEVQAPAGASPGAATAAQVVLKPTGGFHLNKEFPTQLEITPPAGVVVEKATQSIEDAARFEESGAEFAVNFTAKEAGEKQFTATFRFAVCTETRCDPKRETLAWNVAVK